jgi:hypothetical protein
MTVHEPEPLSVMSHWDVTSANVTLSAERETTSDVGTPVPAVYGSVTRAKRSTVAVPIVPAPGTVRSSAVKLSSRMRPAELSPWASTPALPAEEMAESVTEICWTPST